MATGIAEDIAQHVRRAIHHRGLLFESRSGGDVASHGEDAHDAIERTELRLQHCQRVQGADLRRLVALLHRDVVPQDAKAGELTIDARQLSRRAGDAVVHHHRVERIVGRMRPVKGEAELLQTGVDTIHRVPEHKPFTVRAEPLTAAAFAPFGQLVKEGDMVMELRGEEVFHLNVLHYERGDLRCDHLNRHHRATQMLVALAGKPTLLVVAPKELDFSTEDHLSSVRAFICDGTAGVNLALGTWHWGPYPIHDEVDLVNVQGKNFSTDNEVAYLARDLGVVVEVVL